MISYQKKISHDLRLGISSQISKLDYKIYKSMTKFTLNFFFERMPRRDLR